jgi:hypothetical protein
MKTVNIECRQVVHYNQIIELTDEEFELIDKAEDLSERISPEAFYLLRSKIDAEDVFDSEPEFSHFEMNIE